MTTGSMNAGEILLDCQSAWKIFGTRAPAAMDAVQRRNLGKREVLQEFDCVVGVSDASFQVGRGEIFCIMGLSGSGKSTLIRMLNRLIEPTSGQIKVKGRDIGAMSEPDLRELRAKHMAMVFQSVALLPNRTVLENAAFGLEVRGLPKAERNQTAKAALAKVGLADWMERYPGELSGGMQQRVGLARALTSDPEIILMDEPFSALDPLIRRQLQDEFRQLTKELGKSAIFITHDLDEAIRIGDRIAIMKDGVIIQTGTAEELILNPADDYVAEFVAGISKLHLIKAHSVMIPPAEFQREHPGVGLESLPLTSPDTDIDGLIELMVGHRSAGLAVVEAGQIAGVVTPTSLLLGVKGSQASETGGH
ncbi:glycine betaine/proline transport system ATP-binding protein [Paracoccus versutus]|uniref:Quaternary amine transport ATP-binding protein n=2 Tax=Paracoccus versutus TaxID=34007 RepID=A0AAQ0KK75_PARVE|nr:glycine betaine/proline transport system ATP-binding protein [Paracoccus versutus]SFY43233.1 glycine betaine/proline transport system ATP-binding protein [Paracoccus pantotrophus]